MLIYHKTKAEFLDDLLTNAIDKIVLTLVQDKLKHGSNKSQIGAWKHSLQAMGLLLNDPEIPADCGVSIEYKLPNSGKLIDFALTGQDEHGGEHVIIVELKQWQKAEATSQDGLVVTFINGANRAVTHPSYQAYSYAALLRNFNATVQEENITLHPCAYLHNYAEDPILTGEQYTSYVEKAPLFFQDDAKKLRAFIKGYLKQGDSANVMARIDAGKLRPSKSLADSLTAMLGGQEEFVLVDEQKVVYEQVMQLARQEATGKHVLLIEGDPGTGKSVVAINLLVGISALRKPAQYVTKNGAPRAVYASKLIGTTLRQEYGGLFVGSGGFVDTPPDTFEVLLVDESHRLTEKSDLYGIQGDNQIKELITSARVSVFFLDEKQRVTLKDIGNKAAIQHWAAEAGATLHELTLSSQFRCNGSLAYLNWLDEVLQLPTETEKQPEPAGLDFDFQVLDSPNALRALIEEKNHARNKARLVAGYCWPWPSKKGVQEGVYDVVLPDHDFAIRWNLSVDGGLWIMNPASVKEIGCIHTCQGLEVDYIGVLIGPDFVVRNGRVVTDATKRASSDRSVYGHKKLSKEHPQETAVVLDAIIKNTYRTLLTRGLKGCYVYCTDPETQHYFRQQLTRLPLEAGLLEEVSVKTGVTISQ
jgi:DUF2075 family protein